MRARDLAPDRRQSLFSLTCGRHSWTCLARSSRALGLGPKVRAFAYGSRWMEAHVTLAQLGSSRLQADLVAYGALASALQRGQQWEKALSLLEQVRPDERLLGAVVAAAAGARQWPLALGLLQGMGGRRLVATKATVAPVLTALVSSRQWRRALETFRTAPGARDAQIYSQMVMTCEQQGLEPEQLMQQAIRDLAPSAVA